ncbi:RluA family pseudouridine synthase [Paenibacillus mesophilus]|uniref:RluA family pseudouridine synthase n=1 Tax=Paenibacillus mesophilus TaxID=2582849 RepID=UPI00110EECE9|nr:RluA family pseudouridine synthase [Paenibacillus mesophilus]TMV44720.1 RluA family pseudouridine synthase [Paenibacillus mesophilus]
MNYYEPLTYVVPQGEDGAMLKTILRDRMQLSRKLLSRLKLTPEGITVNGVRRYTSARVQAGDVVEIRMEEEQSEDILPQPMPLDILHEDDQLLIVNKPAGIIVHPTHGHYTNTIANGVVHYWLERGEKIRFRPVHRLDRETSGVLAIAKNPYAHQHISEQMQAGAVEKSYLAIVHGSVATDGGTIDAPIDRDPESPHVRIVTPGGYRSVTHYETVERYGAAASLVRLRLETGRTHQIRVHMKHIGHPLVGDAMYGIDADPEEGTETEALANTDADAKKAEGISLDRHALHAARLAFAHPADRSRIGFEAPLPEDMVGLIGRLRRKHHLE